jgi:hypothetical protein
MNRAEKFKEQLLRLFVWAGKQGVTFDPEHRTTVESMSPQALFLLASAHVEELDHADVHALSMLLPDCTVPDELLRNPAFTSKVLETIRYFHTLLTAD